MSAIARVTDHPKDEKTGLTLPLSKSLGSQDLAQHRAMVATELEVLAKKMDRFGWDRDRGTFAHDRIVMDWMDALQDYPLDEVQAACKAAVIANPNKIPNEGHVRAQIIKARARFVRKQPKLKPEPEILDPLMSKERAAEIMEEVGFNPNRFGKTAAS